MIPQGCVSACPACRYRVFPASESNQRKQAWAEDCLSGTAAVLLPLRSPDLRWGYRRKALLHTRLVDGKWAFGMLRRRGREAELIPIPHCPLHAPALNHRLAVLRGLLPIDAPLAFVLASGDFFTLVLKCAPNAAWRNSLRALEGPLLSAGLQGLQVNWNPSAGRRVISSRHQEALFGPPFLHDGSGYYGPLSFRQQIPQMENEAYSAAEIFLAAAGTELALDLYCGTGATLARWQARGWKSLGVELVGEACGLAERNAPGAMLLKGRVEDRIPQMAEFVGSAPFVLFTNPPRDGHHRSVTNWILAQRPLRIAYLSCNQRSLARDLEQLKEAYRPASIQPFDFFPQTDHVESLTLLLKA